MRRIAVVHPTTLLGKELRERLEARPDLAGELVLLSVDQDEIGAVTDSLGAAAFVARAQEGSFDGIDLAFFCGPIELDRQAVALLPAGVPAILLSRGVTGADAPAAVAGLTPRAPSRAVVASPHPAAVALALLLAPLRRRGLRRAIATAVLPVSAADDAAIEELFEQTRELLSFSGGSSERFGGQVAFNLLPAGLDPAPLVAAVREALAPDAPEIALQLLQGGIFHGISLSVWIEVGAEVEAATLGQALAAAPGLRIAEDASRLGPVAAASDDDLLVGEIRSAGAPGTYWLWAVLDNLGRGAALNAIGLAEELLGEAPAA